MSHFTIICILSSVDILDIKLHIYSWQRFSPILWTSPSSGPFFVSLNCLKTFYFPEVSLVKCQVYFFRQVGSYTKAFALPISSGNRVCFHLVLSDFVSRFLVHLELFSYQAIYMSAILFFYIFDIQFFWQFLLNAFFHAKYVFGIFVKYRIPKIACMHVCIIGFGFFAVVVLDCFSQLKSFVIVYKFQNEF